MRTHRIVAALLLAGTSLDAASAQVVMRRPIPSLDGRSDIPSENPTPTPTPTPGATPTPTTGTPSPTPTPTPTGTPTPVGTPTPTPTGTPTPTPTDTPSDCSTTMSCPNPEADVYAWNVDCRLPAPSIQCMSYEMRQGMYGYTYRQWGVASDPTGCTSTQTADQNGFARMRGYYGLDSGFSATNDKGLCKGVQYDTDLPTGDPDPTFPPGSYIYANWDTGAWRTISGGTCGSTTIMEREVHCVASVYDSSYRLLHGGPIDAKYCADKGTQPTTRYQSESAGCYSWQLGQFSDWSSTCGFAQRQASYFCADSQGNKVDDARCTLIPREGDQYGGMSGSSKPYDERDYSTQTSGCTKKLDLGSPEVGYCENNVQDVTYPQAYCGLYDKNGSYAGSTDIAECGGYPEPKQQPCGDALIQVPEPTDKSCLYNPYVEYYYGNNGGIDYGASREFIYSNGTEACEQGLAKGYTCCMVGSIYDKGEYVSGPLKGAGWFSGYVSVAVAYKPRAQVYGSCQVMLNDWVAKIKAKREKDGYVAEWRGEDCGFIEPGPANPNNPPQDPPMVFEPLG